MTLWWGKGVFQACPLRDFYANHSQSSLQQRTFTSSWTWRSGRILLCQNFDQREFGRISISVPILIDIRAQWWFCRKVFLDFLEYSFIYWMHSEVRRIQEWRQKYWGRNIVASYVVMKFMSICVFEITFIKQFRWEEYRTIRWILKFMLNQEE